MKTQNKKNGETAMKKFLLLVLCFALVFTFTGCVSNEKADKKTDELVSYINNDLAELADIEEAFLESYESVTGDNYVDDYTTYEELSNNTLPLIQQLDNKTVEISENITDNKIREVHRLYMNYTSKNLNAIITMIDALETQDVSRVTDANDMINEANNVITDFQIKLDELMDEYGVVME